MPTLTKSKQRPSVVDNYDVAADAQGRVVLRNTCAKKFHVSALSNGSYLLEPQVLISPAVISSRILKLIDKSAANLKRGRVSSPLNLAVFYKG